MPLSCSCDWDYEPEPGQWIFYHENDLDFKPLKSNRAKRCCSCNNLVKLGDECLSFERYRYPYNEIEAKINNVDWDGFEEPTIKMSDLILCEKCGEIYLNLNNVGFECLLPTENMQEMLRQYQVEYVPPKLNL